MAWPGGSTLRSATRAQGPALLDGSVDAVLLLGPLYHLEDRADRVRALAEARRVGRPGAVVIAAAISRWAARLHGVMTERSYLALPQVLDILAEVGEPDGNLPPLHPACRLACHTHRPDELSEAVDAGLALQDLVGLEGHTFALPDLAERLADDLDREVLLDSLRLYSAGARSRRALPAHPPRCRSRPLSLTSHRRARRAAGRRRRPPGRRQYCEWPPGRSSGPSTAGQPR